MIIFLFSFLYYLVRYDVGVYKLGIIIRNIRILVVKYELYLDCMFVYFKIFDTQEATLLYIFSCIKIYIPVL